MSAYAVPLKGEADNSSTSVDALLAQAEFLKAERSTADENWASIAEVTRPLRNELRGTQTPGNKRMARVFDATAIGAAQNMAAGLYGNTANPAAQWFTLGDIDPEFTKWRGVSDYYRIVSLRTLASFGPSFSGFYGQAPTLFLDEAAFGNAVLSSEMAPDRSRFRDICRPLSECYWDVNADGDVNTMHRRPQAQTARQAVELYGKDKVSPKLSALAAKEPNSCVDIISAVVPNDRYVEGRFGHAGKPFVSVVFEVETKHEISRGGFLSFPFFVPRWEVAAGEKIGRGQGEIAYPDNKSLQVMTRTNLQAGELAGNPPWGAPDEGRISVLRTAPGKVTYGAINSRGEQLVRRLVENVNAPFSVEMANQLRQSIKDAFFFSIMQFANRTGMTPTEFLQYSEEKMRLMGPYVARIQNDLLAPLVMRRFELLSKIPGVFPVPPREVQGRRIHPVFKSPLALAQKSAAAQGVLRAAAGVQAIMAIDPTVVDRFNGKKAFDIMADGFGVPDVINDDDTTDANARAREQAQQQMQAMQSAQPLADAAHKGAQAVATLQPPQAQAA